MQSKNDNLDPQLAIIRQEQQKKYEQYKKVEEKFLAIPQANNNYLHVPIEIWEEIFIKEIQDSRPLELIKTICRWRLINVYTYTLVKSITYHSHLFNVVKKRFVTGILAIQYMRRIEIIAPYLTADMQFDNLIEITRKGIASQVQWLPELASQIPDLWKEIKLEHFFNTSRLIRKQDVLINIPPETWVAGLRFAALIPGPAAQPASITQLRSILVHLDSEEREKYLTKIITDETFTLPIFFGYWQAHALDMLCNSPLTTKIISEVIQSLLQRPLFQNIIKNVHCSMGGMEDWVRILNKIDPENMPLAKQLLDCFIARSDSDDLIDALHNQNVSISFLKNLLEYLLDTKQIFEYANDIKFEEVFRLYVSCLEKTSEPALFDKLLSFNCFLTNHYIRILCARLPQNLYAKIFVKHLEEILAKCDLNTLHFPGIIRYINSADVDFFIKYPQTIMALRNQLTHNTSHSKLFLKIIDFLAQVSPQDYENILKRMTEQSKMDINHQQFYKKISSSNNIFNLLLAAADCLKSSFFSTFYSIPLTSLDKVSESEKIKFIDDLYEIDPTIFNYFNDNDNLPSFIEPHSQMTRAMLIAQIKNYRLYCQFCLSLMEKNNEKIYNFFFFQSAMYIRTIKQAAAIGLEQALRANDFSILDQCSADIKKAITLGYLGKIYNYALQHNIGSNNDNDQNLGQSANNALIV